MPKEYIEREAAIGKIIAGKWLEKFMAGKCTVRDIVDALPAADVRPVVLCRDCGHWNRKNQHPSKRSRDSVAMCAWFSRNYGTIETSEDDWCSYGYRMEES